MLLLAPYGRSAAIITFHHVNYSSLLAEVSHDEAFLPRRERPLQAGKNYRTFNVIFSRMSRLTQADGSLPN